MRSAPSYAHSWQPRTFSALLVVCRVSLLKLLKKWRVIRYCGKIISWLNLWAIETETTKNTPKTQISSKYTQMGLWIPGLISSNRPFSPRRRCEHLSVQSCRQQDNQARITAPTRSAGTFAWISQVYQRRRRLSYTASIGPSRTTSTKVAIPSKAIVCTSPCSPSWSTQRWRSPAPSSGTFSWALSPAHTCTGTCCSTISWTCFP